MVIKIIFLNNLFVFCFSKTNNKDIVKFIKKLFVLLKLLEKANQSILLFFFKKLKYK